MLEPSPGAGGRRAFDPVVVYAPLRRDGPALVELLAREELDVTLCTTLMELGVALEAPVGMFVFTQEAFSGDMLNLLQPWLEAQEAWSEPPVLALIDPRQHGRARGSHIAEALPNATSIVLERPVRALELLSSVRISLATRRRQLDLRDQFLLQADLLRELSHRVKNALANVYAVYRLTYRHAEDLPSFGKVFEARLQALSRVHELLTSSGWQGADLKAMARETLRPYAETTEAATDGVETLAGAGTGRVSLTGPSVPLPPRQALSAAADPARARRQRGAAWCAQHLGRPGRHCLATRGDDGRCHPDPSVDRAGRAAGAPARERGLRHDLHPGLPRVRGGRHRRLRLPARRPRLPAAVPGRPCRLTVGAPIGRRCSALGRMREPLA